MLGLKLVYLGLVFMAVVSMHDAYDVRITSVTPWNGSRCTLGGTGVCLCPWKQAQWRSVTSWDQLGNVWSQ